MADTGRHLDLITLDADRFGTVLQKSAERSVRLKAHQQHRGPAIPKPTLEMMPDTAGVAHAAGGNDDVEAREFRNRLALVHGFREPEVRRTEQTADIDSWIYTQRAFKTPRSRGSPEGSSEKLVRWGFLRVPSGRPDR